MASPLTVVRNDYHNNRKNSTVFTPVGVARFLFDILWPAMHCRGVCFDKVVLDPAIGTQRLTDPWWDAGCAVFGCDVVQRERGYKNKLSEFVRGKFESIVWNYLPRPDLVLCNPLCGGPHNGFYVAHSVMLSSSFLQPYFSILPVFCTT
jgi:hypothetical protein